MKYYLHGCNVCRKRRTRKSGDLHGCNVCRKRRTRKSGDLHGCNGRKLLLHFRHFRHPWRSYIVRARRFHGCKR